jgi:hypothetical protein
VDIGAEPIDPELKTCILTELATQPGSHLVKRRGHLFFQNRTGRFEILCERLCEINADTHYGPEST